MRNIDGNSGSASLAPAVLTDFDDTAAAQNVGEMLLNRFGDSTWPQLRHRFHTGELTLKEYQEIAFRNIQGRPGHHAGLREGACHRAPLLQGAVGPLPGRGYTNGYSEPWLRLLHRGTTGERGFPSDTGLRRPYLVYPPRVSPTSTPTRTRSRRTGTITRD